MIFTRMQNTSNESEVTTYISGLSTPLSQGQINRLNIFVRELKSGFGINLLSSVFDIMYILNGETEESSLRNLINSSYTCTNISGATFTQYQGFNSNGTSSYLNTNFKPGTNKVNLSLDSTSIGFYAYNSQSTGIPFGTVQSTTSYLAASSVLGSIGFRINQGNAGIFTPDASIGMFIGNRVLSTELKVYKNSAFVTTITQSTTTIPISDVYILRRNWTTPNYTTSKYSFSFLGRGLTESEITILTNAYNNYLISI